MGFKKHGESQPATRVIDPATRLSTGQNLPEPMGEGDTDKPPQTTTDLPQDQESR